MGPFRVIAVFTIFFSTWLAVDVAAAKDIWIHVVGIDDENPEQNVDDFYLSAEWFLDACKHHSSSTLECHLFVDTNSSLIGPSAKLSFETLSEGIGTIQAPSKETPGSGLQLFTRPPQKDEVLGELRSALENSGPNDQVIFSIKDHGAPGVGTPSCIYLNSRDNVCVNEVSKIISKYKKSGTKLFISMEGCFSGGFHELNQKDVCVYAQTDRYRTGYADGEMFWLDVISQLPNAATVADLAVGGISSPYGKGYSSNVIRARQCVDSKSKITLRDSDTLAIVKRMTHFLKDFKLIDCDCDFTRLSEDEQSRTVGGLESRIGNPIITNEFKQKICAAQGKSVCELAVKIFNEQPTINAFMQKLLPFYEKFEKAKKLHEDQDYTLTIKIDHLEGRQDRHSVDLKKTLKKQRAALLETSYQEKDDFFKAARELAQVSPAIRSYYSDLNHLFSQLCIELNDPAPTKLADAWNSKYKPRYFGDERTPKSNKALREAQECEQNFRLY